MKRHRSTWPVVVRCTLVPGLKFLENRSQLAASKAGIAAEPGAASVAKKPAGLRRLHLWKCNAFVKVGIGGDISQLTACTGLLLALLTGLAKSTSVIAPLAGGRSGR